MYYAVEVLRSGGRLVWRRLSFLFAVLGIGVVTFFVTVLHAGVAWALTVVIASLLLVTVTGGYGVWSALEERVRTLGTQPVTPEHREHLRRMLEAMQGAIVNDRVCGYGDPSTGRQLHREEFLAHFPDLGAELEHWNAAVARQRDAPAALRTAFDTVVRERGLDEAPYAGQAVAEILAAWTRASALSADPAQVRLLEWANFTTRRTGFSWDDGVPRAYGRRVARHRRAETRRRCA